MSSSNSTLVIVSLGIGIVVIMGVGGLVAYQNVNNQLVSTQAQLQQLQKERDDLKKQSEDKDKEIKDLHGTIIGGKDEIERKLIEIKKAKEETQTVSGCLKGVVEALSYTDDQGKAIFALSKSARKNRTMLK